jgi:hypothetical protein
MQANTVVLEQKCYPVRLQYWQRMEVTGLFTEPTWERRQHPARQFLSMS